MKKRQRMMRSWRHPTQHGLAFRPDPNSKSSAFASARFEAAEASSSPRIQPASPALMSAKRSLHEPTLEGDENISEEGDSHSGPDAELQEKGKLKQVSNEKGQKRKMGKTSQSFYMLLPVKHLRDDWGLLNVRCKFY
eukprot:1141193-Pelagomonas_calceolata.AAC.4